MFSIVIEFVVDKHRRFAGKIFFGCAELNSLFNGLLEEFFIARFHSGRNVYRKSRVFVFIDTVFTVFAFYIIRSDHGIVSFFRSRRNIQNGDRFFSRSKTVRIGKTVSSFELALGRSDLLDRTVPGFRKSSRKVAASAKNIRNAFSLGTRQIAHDHTVPAVIVSRIDD